MSKIGIPAPEDLESCVQLWRQVFQDEEPDIQYFLSLFFPSCALTAKTGGKTVSALYLLDCTLTGNGRTFQGKYLYAAATAPEYRRQGLMSRLIQEAIRLQTDAGTDFICLYPAEESLYGYYARFGFREVFHAAVCRTNAAGDMVTPVYEPEKAREIRKQRYGENAVLLCPPAFLAEKYFYPDKPLFPDYTESGHVKMPVFACGGLPGEWTTVKDGMLLPLSDRMPDFPDAAYLGLTLQ